MQCNKGVGFSSLAREAREGGNKKVWYDRLKDSQCSADSIDFKPQTKLFERALASLSNGSLLSAMSTNGMAVSAVMNDDDSLRLCNSLIVRGALAAGISGSGPAVAAICHTGSEGAAEILEESCEQVVRTRITRQLGIEEGVDGWG